MVLPDDLQIVNEFMIIMQKSGILLRYIYL